MTDLDYTDRFRVAKFEKSASQLKQCPASAAEVAFIGRSNAGKSSALNVLTGQKKLARTSKTPGRTQLMNFFHLSEDKYLVDLPGYGFAQVPQAVKQQIQTMLQSYLGKRTALKGIILLSDCRHPVQKADEILLELAAEREVPVHILLTKADKLSKNQQQSALAKVKRLLKAQYPLTTAQLFSSLNRQGLLDAHTTIMHWLEMDA